MFRITVLISAVLLCAVRAVYLMSETDCHRIVALAALEQERLDAPC